MGFGRTGLSTIWTLWAIGAASAALGQDAREALLPVGSRIVVRTAEPVESADADENRGYAVTLAQDVRVNGAVVVKGGTQAVVRVTMPQRNGPGASLRLRLTAVYIDGEAVPVETSPVKPPLRSKGRLLAGQGRTLGGILGGALGGQKGASIGTEAAQDLEAASRQVEVAANTEVAFTLLQPAGVRANAGSRTANGSPASPALPAPTAPPAPAAAIAAPPATAATTAVVATGGLTASPYQYRVVVQTGQVVGDHQVAQIGGLQIRTPVTSENPALQLMDDGTPVFLGLSEQGLETVFTSRQIIAMEHVRLGGAWIAALKNFATGGGKVAVEATYRQESCAVCNYVGLFVDGRIVLQREGYRLGSLTMDKQGTSYVVASRPNSAGPALYKDGTPWIAAGDAIPQGKVVEFGRGLRVAGDGTTVIVPITYSDGVRPATSGGMLVNGSIVAGPRNFVGLAQNLQPITRDMIPAVAGRDLLLNDVADRAILSEANWAVKGRAAGAASPNQEAVYTSHGLTITSESIQALVPGIPHCCAFIGPPAINAVGDVAVLVRSQSGGPSAAIVVASTHALPATPAASARAQTFKPTDPPVQPSPAWDQEAAMKSMEMYGIRPPQMRLVLRDGSTVNGGFYGRAGDAIRILTADGTRRSIPIASIHSCQQQSTSSDPFKPCGAR